MKKTIAALLAFLFLFSIAASAGLQGGKPHWAQNAVDRWQDEDVIPVDEDIILDIPLNRGELAFWLSHFLGLEEKAENTFEDLSEEDQYTAALLKCVQAGIFKGTGIKMEPFAVATREMAVVCLGRAFGLLEEEREKDGIEDEKMISSWAQGYVFSFMNQAFLQGDQNRISPQEPLSMAELLTLLDRMIYRYITEPGTYTLEGKGIVLVKSNQVFLEGSLDGNVIVAQNQKSGELNLQNAKISGTLAIYGSNLDVIITDSSIQRIELYGENCNIRFLGSSICEQLTVHQTAADTIVEVNDSSRADCLVIDADGVAVSGFGKVAEALVSGSNVSFAISGVAVCVQPGASNVTQYGYLIQPGTTVVTQRPGGGSGTGEPEDSENFVIGSLWWTNKFNSSLIDPESQESAWWDNEVIINRFKSNFVSVYFAVNTFANETVFDDIAEKIGYEVAHLNGRFWLRPAELCQYSLDITQAALEEAKELGLSVMPSVNTYCYSASGYQSIYEGKKGIIEKSLLDGEISQAQATAEIEALEKYKPENLAGRTPNGAGPEYEGMPISCISNPYWIEIQKDVVEMHVRAGYPGMYYDLYPYSSGAGLLCSCDHCKEKWAAYSEEAFGSAKDFPSQLLYASPDSETSAVSLAFYEFRRLEWDSFIDTMEQAGKAYDSDFKVYLNSSIDNMSHQAALMDGLYQPTSEIHQITTGDMSGLYMFRMSESISDQQLLAHYNSTKDQIKGGFYQIYTILAEAYAGGGGYFYLASNGQQRPDYEAFSEFLLKNISAYKDTEAVSETAILYSWENHNYMQADLNKTKTAYSQWTQNDARKPAEILAQNGIPYDYVSIEKNQGNLLSALQKYKIVVVPEMKLVNDNLTAELKQYAENGGVLLILGPFGTYESKIGDDGNLYYAANSSDVIDGWVNAVTNPEYSVTALGEGRVIRLTEYATSRNSPGNIRASQALKDAFEESGIFEALKVSEGINGHVESTLRKDKNKNYYLNLINFGIGSNDRIEDKAYHVSLALPDELKDGNFSVSVEAPFNLPITKVVSSGMLEEDTYGYVPGSYYPTIEQCRIIDGRLEVHANFGLYSLVTLQKTGTPLVEMGPETPMKIEEKEEELRPLEISGGKIGSSGGTGTAFRMIFKGTHALIEEGGMLWAVLDAGETLEDVTSWNEFSWQTNAGFKIYGGTGWQKQSWDAMFHPKGKESIIPALQPGQRVVVRIRKDKVVEHPEIGEGTLENDAYFTFSSLAIDTLAKPYEEELYISNVEIREGKPTITFANQYADIEAGGLLYSIESNGSWSEFASLEGLKALRSSDGSVSEDMYDWVCDLPEVTLGAGEKLIMKVLSEKVQGQKIGAGAVEFVPNGALLPETEYFFSFESLEDGSKGSACTEPTVATPLAVAGAPIRKDQAGIRVSFGKDHVKVGADGFRWGILKEGTLFSDVEWKSFTALVGGWKDDGGESFGQYQWDGRYAMKDISLEEGDLLLLEIDAGKVTERVKDGGQVIDGERIMEETVYYALGQGK